MIRLAASKPPLGGGRLVGVVAFACLLAAVLGAMATLDSLSRAPARHARAPDANVALPGGRMLVLLIDSLRYETAVDPAIMPNLVALREQSTFARVKATRDAVTVSSVRAAFTGNDGVRVLAFISNFLSRNAGIESVFTDLAAVGRKGATLSDNAFKQFGLVGRREFPNGGDGPTEVRDQDAASEWAADLYRRGEYDLAVMHITYTDHIAHQVGVGSPRYIERFAAADRIVANLAAATQAGDTFVVMGDHGHDLKGRHTFGLDVPTFALYRGSRFRPAHDLGTIALLEHRYFMGWALGLALPAGYDGAYHPDALLSTAPLPRMYAEAPRAGGGHVASANPHPDRRIAYGATIAALAVALSAWVLLLRPARSGPRVSHTVVGGVLLLVVGAAFAASGASFLSVRPWLHEPRFTAIAECWAGLWLVAFGIARLRRDTALAWPLLVLPLFVLVPTVYRYGAAPALAPAWMGFLLCAALATGGAMSSPSASGAQTPGLLHSPSLGVLLFTLAMLFPFSGAESSNYRFDTWVFYPVEVGGGAEVWVALALLAKFILFLRVDAKPATQRAGLVGMLLVVAVEVDRPPATAELVLALALLVVAWFAKAPPRATLASDVARPVGDVALIAGILLLFMALTQADPEVYLWLDCLLAALLLSGRFVGLVTKASTRSLGYAWLLLFAWFGTGWVSFAWTVHRLEWHFLYDWFSAPTVERYVWLVVPLVLARCLLPLILARVLLAESLGRPELEVRRLAWTLAGAKVLTVVLFAAGIGWADSQSDAYLEAAQETGVAAVLTAGLL